MSEIKYTKAQKEAIDIRDKNIIVSAAAGSGKTRVLVDRIIKLIIEDKKSLESMIIVTFTNKASIEMKDRIREKLEKSLRENKNDYKFLKNELNNINKAQIKTMHAFCADMIREYFYHFDNLSPNFKVITENNSLILKKDAIDEVFDRHYEKMDEGFEEFLHNFAKNKSDEKAKEVVLKTYEKIMGELDPLGYLEKSTRDSFNLENLKENIREKIEELASLANEQLNQLKAYEMREKLIDLASEDLAIINDLKKSMDDNWDTFLKKLAKVKFPRLSSSKNDDKKVYEAYKNARNINKEDLKTISNLLINTDELTMKIFTKKEANLLETLESLVREFMENFTSKKKEKSVLDFNDMEHFFIKLLEIDEVRSRIRQRFTYIFFDEYQDSNEIQNYIIEKIKSDNNLFFVGDVKQSIYGFRRAEPSLFLEKLETYKNDPLAERIDLNQNFRSEKDILDFDNYIFTNLMSKEKSGIDYKNGGHLLNFAKDNKSLHKRVSVDILDDKLSEEDYLVKRINSLLEEGYRYRDIAILLRSGAKAYSYEQSLKAASIPFFNDISKVSFRAVEVSFFINLLKYIANPKDDLTLLSILRSDIFDINEDDLVKIKLGSQATKFYEAFENYSIDDEILGKINDIKSIFLDLSYKLSLMNLYDFGNYLFEMTYYRDYLLSRDRSSDRIENVESFIEMMGEYDRENNNGLFGFLDFIENLSLNRSDNINTTRDLSEKEDLVRIMTIHKSKGLEFPVVILADMAKRFNINHLREDIVFDNKLGIGINVSDYENKVRISSIRKLLINDKISLENKKEEMRVLYVAMTRPSERLILVGNKNISKLDEIAKNDDYLKQNSYIDWIISILAKDRLASFYSDTYQTDDLSKFTEINLIDDIEKIDKYTEKPIDQILENLDIEDDTYDNFKKIYDMTYPYEADVDDPIKKSVTELAKNFDPQMQGFQRSSFDRTNQIKSSEVDFKTPNFLEKNKIYTPTDKGSIIHKIFQSSSLKSYKKDEFIKEIEKIIARKIIDKEDINLIEEEKFLGFFNDEKIKKYVEKATNIRKEESFLMKYDGYLVNGQIDLMIEDDESIILIDFKTDRIKREGYYLSLIHI